SVATSVKRTVPALAAGAVCPTEARPAAVSATSGPSGPPSRTDHERRPERASPVSPRLRVTMPGAGVAATASWATGGVRSIRMTRSALGALVHPAPSTARAASVVVPSVERTKTDGKSSHMPPLKENWLRLHPEPVPSGVTPVVTVTGVLDQPPAASGLSAIAGAAGGVRSRRNPTHDCERAQPPPAREAPAGCGPPAGAPSRRPAALRPSP